ncbi:MAG: UDP-glucose 4-epimerase [Candidatus Marinimicrobia bacterium]|nr:UDP-glucose 4-epimerase [Candidatus Neomarinimicrobiota bacterium]|tara:strand:- start:7444 stop:8454 length:1011 start_codon:yes stop_codon:yes gene_type:complete
MTCSIVTGAAGFIGAHVAKHLLENGHSVIVLDDLSGGSINNVPDGAEFVKGSIVDQELIEKLFKKYRFDYVFHLAAYAAEGLSHFIRRYNYTNNLIGSVNLINASIKYEVQCFVFTSSIAVYGKGSLPLKEEMNASPEDPYGIAKLAVEQDLATAHAMFGLNYIIFRPHNVYGEYQNIGDRYRNVVGIFMNQLMKKKPLTIFGDGKQTRAFSYIGDVAPYISSSVEVLEAYNNVFNIGADKACSVNELAKEVMHAMNIDGRIEHLPERNEVLHAYSSHSKLLKFFNIDQDSFTNLDVGLTRMAEWVKTVGIRKSKPFSDIEIIKNLPPVWLKKNND